MQLCSPPSFCLCFGWVGGGWWWGSQCLLSCPSRRTCTPVSLNTQCASSPFTITAPPHCWVFKQSQKTTGKVYFACYALAHWLCLKFKAPLNQQPLTRVICLFIHVHPQAASMSATTMVHFQPADSKSNIKPGLMHTCRFRLEEYDTRMTQI